MQSQLEEARAIAQEVTSAQEKVSSLNGTVDNLNAQLEAQSKQLQDVESMTASLQVYTLSCLSTQYLSPFTEYEALLKLLVWSMFIEWQA